MEARVGIELKRMMKKRKLLSPQIGENAKNTGFAQVGYTPGTRRFSFDTLPFLRNTGCNFIGNGDLSRPDRFSCALQRELL